MNKVINFLIYGSLLLSIVGILFHIGIIPPIFGEAKRFQEINEVIVNLSYSYLAGFIFYVLIELLPSWSRRKRAMSVLSSKFVKLYSTMDRILAITKMEAGLDKENKTIVLEDCSFAKEIDFSVHKVAYYVDKRKNKSEWTRSNEKEWYETINYKAELAKEIKTIIESINSTVFYAYLSDSFRETLDRIYNSTYLKDLKILQNNLAIVKFTSSRITDANIHLYDYIKLIIALNKFSFEKQEHKFVKMENKYQMIFIQNSLRLLKSFESYFTNKAVVNRYHWHGTVSHTELLK